MQTARIEDNAASVRSAIGAAPLASPAFTGVPTAPTAAEGTSTTQLATTEFVAAALENIPTSPGGTVDYLSPAATLVFGGVIDGSGTPPSYGGAIEASFGVSLYVANDPNVEAVLAYTYGSSAAVSLANLPNLAQANFLSSGIALATVADCPLLETLSFGTFGNCFFGSYGSYSERGVIRLAGDLSSLAMLECPWSTGQFGPPGLRHIDVRFLTAIKPEVFIDISNQTSLSQTDLEDLVIKLASFNVAYPGGIVTGGMTVTTRARAALIAFSDAQFSYDISVV